MRADELVRRWTGPALTAVGAVATLWLTATGRLSLYIHPRYTLFTATMSVLALAAVVAVVALRADGERDHHDHPQDQDEPGDAHDLVTRAPRSSRWSTTLRILIVAAAVWALLVVPPATLSATARQSRALVTSSQALDSADTTVLAGGDPATFTVKDWANLLRQGGPQATLGKQVDVTGYVLDQGDDNVFYLARLMVSCCAVDAQPIGIPISQPGWRQHLRPGSWLKITGTFAGNPDAGNDLPALVQVATLDTVTEPKQPYVF